MKADEWKHWVLVYSLYCLRGVIPKIHFTMWSIFVSACKTICKRSITVSDIEEGHNLLKMFCSSYERIMGKEHCTPNMHLHLHLRECLYNYGPVYAFWCFSWERFNGILGSFHINNHAISIQFMRKYLTGCVARNGKHFNTDFHTFLNLGKDKEIVSNEAIIKLHELHNKIDFTGSMLEFEGCEQVLSVKKAFAALTNLDFECLENLFKKLYPDDKLIRLSRFVTEIKRIKLANELITYSEHRRGYQHGSCVMAKWLGYELDLSSDIIRPAVVESLYEIKLIFEHRTIKMNIARVKWFRTHVKKHHYGINSPTLLWNTIYEDFSVMELIPVKFIVGRFTFVTSFIRFNKTEADNVNIVIPLPSKSF